MPFLFEPSVGRSLPARSRHAGEEPSAGRVYPSAAAPSAPLQPRLALARRAGRACIMCPCAWRRSSARHRAGRQRRVRPRATLERAVAALRALPGVQPAGVSRLYRTPPVGPVDQADFWNAALALRVPAGADPDDGALALLVALKGIERDLGRRPRQRWGPRELDLDLLLFGDHACASSAPPTARSDDAARAGPQWLEVPHPLAAERLFVLAPLADLAARPRAAGLGRQRGGGAGARPRRAKVRRPSGSWAPGTPAWQRWRGPSEPAGAPRTQWRKWRRPVKTMARWCRSAISMAISSRTLPPGWMMAVTPRSAASAMASPNGK